MTGGDHGNATAEPVAPTLITPTSARFEAWADCVRDFDDPFGMNGSGWWWIDGFGPDRASCAAMVAKAQQLATDPPEDLVVSDCLWIVSGELVLGFLMLRHTIDNEFLRTQGGHIGYSVRPAYRRRGVATAALTLGLERARGLGLERVLLTCDPDNVASARTIEGCGGVFEGLYAGKRRFWIEL